MEKSIVTIRNDLSSLKDWLKEEHSHLHSFLEQLAAAYRNDVDQKTQLIYQLRRVCNKLNSKFISQKLHSSYLVCLKDPGIVPCIFCTVSQMLTEKCNLKNTDMFISFLMIRHFLCQCYKHSVHTNFYGIIKIFKILLIILICQQKCSIIQSLL